MNIAATGQAAKAAIGMNRRDWTAIYVVRTAMASIARSILGDSYGAAGDSCSDFSFNWAKTVLSAGTINQTIIEKMLRR